MTTALQSLTVGKKVLMLANTLLQKEYWNKKAECDKLSKQI